MSEFINTIDVLGDDAVIDSIIEGTIAEFRDDILKSIGSHAFSYCAALKKIDTPKVTSIGSNAFTDCVSLESVNLPNVTSIGGQAFKNCSKLTLGAEELLLKLPSIWGNETFYGCSGIKFFRLSQMSHLAGNQHFLNCTSLVAFVMTMNQICTLDNSTSFANTPIADGAGYIYVPRALLSDDDETMDYRRATNWSNYAAQFRAIEDYTVDGTVTGEFPRCSGVELDKSTLTFEDWKAQTLTATCENSSPLGIDTVIWSSADPSIATVTDGIVSPVANGSTTITVTCNGYSATCEVVVNYEGIPMMYSLPEPTTFNGSSDYIDTGIQLFDTAKSFTIICEAEFSKLANNICLFHCMNEVSPYPGLNIDGNSGVRICYTGSASITTSISNKNDVSALAIRYVDGKMDAIRYRNASGNIVTHAVSGTPTYTKVTQNLLLGAYQDTSGTKGRFFNGTVSRFDVYSIALSDEQIEALL